MNATKSWVEDAGYARALGVRCEAISEDSVSLLLPFAEKNANPGSALHGGCAASIGVIAGQAIARSALGVEAGPFHTAGLQVNYLAAAIGEDIVAKGALLRRGKNMCFVEVDVATLDGKRIAHVTSMVRARFGAPTPKLSQSRGDDGASDPGPMGPHIGKLNFGRARGLEIEHMTGGRSRITMPLVPADSRAGGADDPVQSAASNACADGGMHEGAVVALLDTTGAMAAWAETGPGPFKASTPALQAQILTPPTDQALVAYGRVVQRDEDGFWSDVEVAGRDDGLIVARGTVLYRIVTGT